MILLCIPPINIIIIIIISIIIIHNIIIIIIIIFIFYNRVVFPGKEKVFVNNSSIFLYVRKYSGIWIYII